MPLPQRPGVRTRPGATPSPPGASVHPFTDQHYLTTQQYRNAGNLSARTALHARFSTNPYGWLRWVFDRLADLPAQARVLELGCGPASLWTHNRERVPGGWDITLSDLSAGMLDEARSALAAAARPFEFQRIDAQSIPFPDSTFDCVIANHMLYHVPDVRRAIDEAARVLNPSGRLFAATNGSGHMHELYCLATDPKLRYRPVLSFTLEGGAEQLRRRFAEVTMERYEDGLRVTEAEALLAYLCSMPGPAAASAQDVESLRAQIAEQLRRDGAVVITKDAGLFIASHQRPA
jgi:ubiquinone/menaquinone biosynthesis C-methylase UbiE